MEQQNISGNALQILKARYLMKNEKGETIETPEEMFARVAKAAAKVESTIEERAPLEADFFSLMQSLRFLPNSPTLMNAGRPLGQLSACFVLPVDDSIESIFEAVKQAAMVHKSGGGTGFSFSSLRPKGAPVQTTGGTAAGPVQFMHVFDAATEAVKQGGMRRGANMAVLRVDHPDILQFIDCKKDGNTLNNFNISVGITEAFMQAVKEEKTYPLIDPHTKAEIGSLPAQKVFAKIVHAAWRNGEPGIVFLDRMNKENPTPALGYYESTNPCGEQPLLPYESCNLGSINLVQMLKQTPHGYEIDEALFEKTIYQVVHFLDNIIDINKFPLAAIQEATYRTRKIGLGIMGFADMLLYMGIPYNTQQGIELGRKTMAFVKEKAHAASIRLAKQKGGFPAFANSIYKHEEAMRNATVTTIAPTGTISIIAGCSSGIEPVFAYVYMRNLADGTQFMEVNPVLKKRLMEENLYHEELLKRIFEEGTLANITEIPKEIRDVFVCAKDIPPKAHVQMQAAFQESTDNAVSKTVNLVSSATQQDVEEVFLLAHTLGCKGVTVYRDKSREKQVLNTGTPVQKKQEENACPLCASRMHHQGGCFTCPQCGFSKCE